MARNSNAKKLGVVDRAGAIVVAAGSSKRMEGVDKLFMPIHGAPLLSHTLAAFEAVPSIQSVVLVLAPTNLERGRELVRQYNFSKISEVCHGGERRQDSVRLGLRCLSPYPWVVIHDGARPCVEPRIIERGLDEAMRWGSAVAGVPVTDTIKVIREHGQVQETLHRSDLWSVQTPQIFPWEVLHRAHQQEGISVTDDAALVELLGYPVHIYFGSYANIKVTTYPDSLIAETLLQSEQRLPT